MKTILLLLSFLQLAHANPGFYSVNDENLPPAVAAAAPSVFEVRTAFFEDFENWSDVSVMDITGDKRAEILTQIDELQDPKQRSIMRAFIDHCKTPEQLSQCPVPLKSNNGSGFITGKGKTFWTNAHVMERVLKLKATMNDKSVADVLSEENTFPIFIFNQDGEMVFNGLENKILFSAVPQPTQLSTASGKFYAEDSDYLGLELPESLGRGLTISGFITSPSVAVIGYPVCTGCEAPEGLDPAEFADRGPGMNAEDCVQKVTGGQILPLENWAQLAQVSAYSMQSLNPQIFFGYNADSQHGMSGAPVLDVDGKVIGIHAGGKTVSRGGQLERYSRGVRPPEFN